MNPINRKITVIGFVCLLAAAALTSCSDEEGRPLIPPRRPPTYKTLTQKDDVLHNLEMAYNELNKEQYNKLLDDDFTFFFSQADFDAGRTPERYSRIQELRAMTLMRDHSRPDYVISINLSLGYTANEWTEVTPDDPQKFPDESWYVANIRYNMTFKTANNMIYTCAGMKAQITIRWATIEGTEEEHWRIIVWRDDI